MTPRNIKIAAFVVGGIFVLGYLAKKQVAATADAISRVNEGTPYEGTGVIGTLGNITNQASGGYLQRFGEYLGGLAADLRGY